MEPAVNPVVGEMAVSMYVSAHCKSLSSAAPGRHLDKGCVETTDVAGSEDALEGTAVMHMQGPGCCMC